MSVTHPQSILVFKTTHLVPSTELTVLSAWITEQHCTACWC